MELTQNITVTPQETLISKNNEKAKVVEPLKQVTVSNSLVIGLMRTIKSFPILLISQRRFLRNTPF